MAPRVEDTAETPTADAALVGALPPRRGRPWSTWHWTIVMIVAALAIAAIATGIYLFGGLHVTVPSPTVAVKVGSTAAGAGQEQSSAVPPAAANISTQTFDDWVVGCPADRVGPCAAQQRLVSSGGQAVLVWNIQRDDRGTLHALWQVPTGVVLGRGLTLDIGDGKPSGVPFSSCDARGCYARAVIAPDYLQKLENAQTILAAMGIEATGKDFTVKLSSRGLAAALDHLTLTN